MITILESALLFYYQCISTFMKAHYSSEDGTPLAIQINLPGTHLAKC